MMLYSWKVTVGLALHWLYIPQAVSTALGSWPINGRKASTLRSSECGPLYVALSHTWTEQTSNTSWHWFELIRVVDEIICADRANAEWLVMMFTALCYFKYQLPSLQCLCLSVVSFNNTSTDISFPHCTVWPD